MNDTISRRDAFHVLDNCRFASEAEKKYAYSLMEQVTSAEPEERTEERTKTHACDLISRIAVYDRVDRIVNVNHLDPELAWFTPIGVKTLIAELPSAQPERKTGWWIERNPQNSPDCRLIECSECGNAYIVGYDIDYDDWIDGRDFCMRCGADLRGGSNGKNT